MTVSISISTFILAVNPKSTLLFHPSARLVVLQQTKLFPAAVSLIQYVNFTNVYTYMMLYSFLSDFDKSNLSEATRLQKVTIQLYFNSPLATERHALLYCKSTDLCALYLVNSACSTSAVMCITLYSDLTLYYR